MTRLTQTLVASIMSLDIYTLSEEWLLSHAMDCTWQILARDMNLPASRWFDAAGARMYAAAMGFETAFDLAHPVREDDMLDIDCTLVAIRKPHAISHTRYLRNGLVVAEARILTSFIRRDQPGSNKKFSKVRDVWKADDVDPQAVDAWLDRHHAAKSLPPPPDPVLTHEVNRLQDFNAADFLYFRNFVRIARAAEWRAGRSAAPRLSAARSGYFYGNVEDGEVITARLAEDGAMTRTLLLGPDDRPLFLSLATRTPVTLTRG